jgi:adenylate cyclase class IV
MAHYEIEIKSLLGAKANAEALKAKMTELDPGTICTSQNVQLNHYFAGGDIKELYETTKQLFNSEQQTKFLKIAEEGSDFSIRTRQRDEEVLLVVKASLDGGTSANTVTRLEFEEAVDLTLEALDNLLLGVGYEYQAKWSREREEYSCKGTTVCIDRNAGYGYLAEFEKVVAHGESVDGVRGELEALMTELGVAELPQERLARMFAHYNQNWADYYGTDKTFTIE